MNPAPAKTFFTLGSECKRYWVIYKMKAPKERNITIAPDVT